MTKMSTHTHTHVLLHISALPMQQFDYFRYQSNPNFYVMGKEKCIISTLPPAYITSSQVLYRYLTTDHFRLVLSRWSFVYA